VVYVRVCPMPLNREDKREQVHNPFGPSNARVNVGPRCFGTCRLVFEVRKRRASTIGASMIIN
jgi:hypothetical protein